MKTKLSALPQVAHEPVDASVTWDGVTYEFSVKQVGYGRTVDPTLAEGEERGPKLLSQLVSFADEDGNLVPLSYEAAALLPPKLGAELLTAALAVNGFGDQSAKN